MPSLMRDQIQKRLSKRIDDMIHGYRQNIGILGPFGVGKTNFLQDFFSTLSLNSNLIPVFIRSKAIDGDQIVYQWLGALIDGALGNPTRESIETLDALIVEGESKIPETIAAVKLVRKFMRRGKKAMAIKELFSLSGKLAEETKKKVILIVDEFQILEKLPVPDPFLLLGKQMMIEKETLYLASSSSIERAKEIFQEKLSLLFGNFEILELLPFGFREMEKYLATRLPGHYFDISLKKFLFALTDGEPLYLDLIMNRLEFFETKKVPEKVSSVILQEIICQELFDHRGRIALIFAARVERCYQFTKNNGRFVRALVALGCGKRKLVHIAAFLEESITETRKVLKRLVEEGLVVKCGSFHHIQDFLFRFWLREVFYKRQGLFSPDDRMLRRHLCTTLGKILEDASFSESGIWAERIEKMLNEFRNDSFEIDQKKIKCPQFSEITVKKQQNSMLSVLARRAKEKWIFQVNSEYIDEEDVTALIFEAKRLRQVKKKVLIALSGIEQNAKLIAQEAKIQIWDLHTLNAMLDFYNLPKIIMMSKKENYEPDLGSLAESISTLLPA